MDENQWRLLLRQLTHMTRVLERLAEAVEAIEEEIADIKLKVRVPAEGDE